jgi:hypothetical protein
MPDLGGHQSTGGGVEEDGGLEWGDESATTIDPPVEERRTLSMGRVGDAGAEVREEFDLAQVSQRLIRGAPRGTAWHPPELPPGSRPLSPAERLPVAELLLSTDAVAIGKAPTVELADAAELAAGGPTAVRLVSDGGPAAEAMVPLQLMPDEAGEMLPPEMLPPGLLPSEMLPSDMLPASELEPLVPPQELSWLPPLPEPGRTRWPLVATPLARPIEERGSRLRLSTGAWVGFGAGMLTAAVLALVCATIESRSARVSRPPTIAAAQVRAVPLSAPVRVTPAAVPAAAVRANEPAVAVRASEPAAAVRASEPAVAVRASEPAAAVRASEPAVARVAAPIAARAPEATPAVLEAVDTVVVRASSTTVGQLRRVAARGSVVQPGDAVAELRRANPDVARKLQLLNELLDQYEDVDAHADELARARADYQRAIDTPRTVTVRARIAGVIVGDPVPSGTTIERGDELVRVAPSLRLRVPAADVEGSGVSCRVTLRDRPSATLSGRLVPAAADARVRTIEVARFPSSLAPGALGRVHAVCN